MKFHNELELLKLEDGSWELLQPFLVSHALRYIEVGVGFNTDLASIPKWLRWLLPVDGEYKESAVVHDWLLKLMYDGNLNLSRAICASTFLDCLIYQKVKPWKITLLYLGVRGKDFYIATKQWWNTKRYWR